jgi:hypothetical protein
MAYSQIEIYENTNMYLFSFFFPSKKVCIDLNS